MCLGIYLSIYLSILFQEKNNRYFPIRSDEVLLKIILKSLIHTNAFNRMEINLLSKCDRILLFFLEIILFALWIYLHWALYQEYLNIQNLNFFICPDGIVPYSGFTGLKNTHTHTHTHTYIHIYIYIAITWILIWNCKCAIFTPMSF